MPKSSWRFLRQVVQGIDNMISKQATLHLLLHLSHYSLRFITQFPCSQITDSQPALSFWQPQSSIPYWVRPAIVIVWPHSSDQRHHNKQMYEFKRLPDNTSSRSQCHAFLWRAIEWVSEWEWENSLILCLVFSWLLIVSDHGGGGGGEGCLHTHTHTKHTE